MSFRQPFNFYLRSILGRAALSFSLFLSLIQIDLINKTRNTHREHTMCRDAINISAIKGKFILRRARNEDNLFTGKFNASAGATPLCPPSRSIAILQGFRR